MQMAGKCAIIEKHERRPTRTALRTISSVGQSSRLITDRPGVRVPDGPPKAEASNYSLYGIGWRLFTDRETLLESVSFFVPRDIKLYSPGQNPKKAVQNLGKEKTQRNFFCSRPRVLLSRTGNPCSARRCLKT